jgi:hypothetical protein
MWWTSGDEGVLAGAECDLFRLGLSILWDDVEMSDDDEEPGTTRNAVFDNLREPERLALLAQSASALHDEGEARPDPTAWSEGTVAAIFAQLRYLIAIEIEHEAECTGPSSPSADRGQSPRRWVLASVREANPNREHPSHDSHDMCERGALLDPLLDRILEGRDDLAGNLLLDADPSRSRRLKALLGIPLDSVAAIPPDLTPEGIGGARDYEEGRKVRYRQAMIRLGGALQGPSQYEDEIPLQS